MSPFPLAHDGLLDGFGVVVAKKVQYPMDQQKG